MGRRLSAILLALMFTAFIASPSSKAQTHVERLGVLSSMKNIGLTVQTSNAGRKNFNSVSLLVDLSGVIVGEDKDPGAKMIWCHEEVLKTGNMSDFRYSIYAGGGCSAGFVRDSSNDTGEKHNHGMEASMVADGGVMFTFRGHIDVSFDLTAELGMHLRKDEGDMSVWKMAMYGNGLLHAWMPQVTIYYRF